VSCAEKRALEIKKYLAEYYLDHAPFLFSGKTIPILERSSLDIRDSVIKVVTSQMLSRAAANTIHNRILAESHSLNVQSWELSEEAYRRCGLSRSKVKTIESFLCYYDSNELKATSWNKISYSELIEEVKFIWGISDWTVGILSIFYFANENVFPKRDTTINRAISLLEEKTGVALVPEKVPNLKSYLALYLWQSIDKKYLLQ